MCTEDVVCGETGVFEGGRLPGWREGFEIGVMSWMYGWVSKLACRTVGFTASTLARRGTPGSGTR